MTAPLGRRPFLGALGPPAGLAAVAPRWAFAVRPDHLIAGGGPAKRDLTWLDTLKGRFAREMHLDARQVRDDLIAGLDPAWNWCRYTPWRWASRRSTDSRTSSSADPIRLVLR